MTVRYVFVAACTAIAALAIGATALSDLAPDVVAKREPKPDRPPEWAQFMLARRVVPGAGEIALDAYPRALAQAKSLRRHSAVSGKSYDVADAKAAPRWEFLGPTNIAGRARTLEFDPRNPDRLLLGGVSGGVWESLDAGSSWRPLSEGAEFINIGALAIDPVEPDTIYAGTGELYRNSGQPYAAMWGQGILVSRDGGRTFVQLSATANDDFRYVADVVLSPHDHRRLYAATNTGLWRSDDAGTSFRQVLRPLDAQGRLRYEGCNELQVLPDGARDRVLAACASRSTDDRYWLPGTILPVNDCGTDRPCPATLFLNEDAGGDGAWQPVLSEAGMGRTILDYARSSPNVVYALSASIVPGHDRNGDGAGDYDNGLHALFRSDDGGRTWQARLRNDSADALSTYLLSYSDNFEQCQGFFDAYSAGWYNMALAVDPRNAEVVWTGGMELYRSDDGGRSFGKASYWTANPNGGVGVHADMHLLRFDPRYDGSANQRLYVANDGGLAATLNANAPTHRGALTACAPTSGGITWNSLVSGLGTTQFYTGAVTPNGTLYMGGTQDNGTLRNSTNGGSRVFAHIFGGDGATVAIDPRNPNTQYVSYQNVNIHRSINGGPFIRATSGIADSSIFIMPYLIDPTAPDRLYAGGSRLWRTNNQGTAWSAASASFGPEFLDKVSALAVAPSNGNRMLVGNQRRIFWNHNATASGGGTPWQSSSPRTGWVSSLNFDPVDANVAYATYSSFGGAHVWRSGDGGQSWSAIDGSGAARLPDIPVHTLAIDPTNRARLFVGTDLGVFVTTDGGASWAVENTGFANTIVESLRVAPGDASNPARLYAFTYGRGVWRVPLADLDGVATYRIGADTSGSFYDPAKPGHGWLIESTEIGGAAGVAAAWYTYLDGEQRWLIGAGPALGNEARVPLFIASGGQFPPAFDPDDVTLQRWGEVTLTFDDANTGRARWTTGMPGYADGEMPLARLSSLSPRVPGELADARIAACHSGTWFNTAQGGHGLMVQVSGTGAERRLLAVWYAHARTQQRWLIGDGPIVGDSATLSMITTRGGAFGTAFDPDTVVREPWGTLTFRAIDADHARIEWSSTVEGFGSGALDLSRLTLVRGLACGG
ncbi:MAG TPA: hypothetical protein VFO79_17340 [Xanthomonadales bacterium]|nr:hypothetical protein [Xanthomonadales bacterium]